MRAVDNIDLLLNLTLVLFKGHLFNNYTSISIIKRVVQVITALKLKYCICLASTFYNVS